MIKGFKITNANFRQENVNLPKGIYTYGVTVRPVGTTLIFKVGAEIFTVPGLQAGVLTRVAHTFTTIQDATVFYPSITVGDQIFEPMLEVGTNASSPQANYLDDNDLVSEAGLKITNETAELYASKSYVNSSIIVSADNITSEVSNQINGLSTSITQTTNSISAKVNTVEEGLRDTGIDITDKKMILTANNVIFKGNNPEDVGKVEIMEGGNIKTVDALIGGQLISPYNIDILTKGGVDNYIDVTKYSNFYVPTMPNGSNQGWYETLLPNEQKYNGLTLNFIWKPFGTGYHWRIKHLSGVIYTENGVVTELDFTSDTDRIIQLAGFWNSGNSRLEWVVTMNKKIGTKKEDRVKAGEIFLTGDINSNGNLLASNSNFGFTFTSQKVVGEIGQYVVSLAKSPNNPLTSTNYMPIITPIAWSTPVFAGAQYPSKASFTVYTRSQIGGVDAQFRFALLATQDLDLRNQYGL